MSVSMLRQERHAGVKSGWKIVTIAKIPAYPPCFGFKADSMPKDRMLSGMKVYFPAMDLGGTSDLYYTSQLHM
jgi:hypothetical protein